MSPVFFAQTKFLRINYAQLMCTFRSAHANQEFLVTTMTAPLSGCLWFPWQQVWKSHLTTLFVLDPSFWDHKGVPPCWRCPQIQWITGTSMPNLDPFFTSSFDHNFPANNNQTFIVYVKTTLVLVRKGLCGFFRFWDLP